MALLLAMGVVSSPVVSGPDLPTPSSGSQILHGIKKRVVETPRESEPRLVMTEEQEQERELLQKSQKSVQILLDCLGTISVSVMFSGSCCIHCH